MTSVSSQKHAPPNFELLIGGPLKVYLEQIWCKIIHGNRTNHQLNSQFRAVPKGRKKVIFLKVSRSNVRLHFQSSKHFFLNCTNLNLINYFHFFSLECDTQQATKRPVVLATVALPQRSVGRQDIPVSRQQLTPTNDK